MGVEIGAQSHHATMTELGRITWSLKWLRPHVDELFPLLIHADVAWRLKELILRSGGLCFISSFVTSLFSDLQQVMTVSIYLHWFSTHAWCEARASVYWWIWAELVPPRLHKKTVSEPKVEARSKFQWEVSVVGHLCFLGKNFGPRLEFCPWTSKSACIDLGTGHKVDDDDDVKEDYDGIKHFSSWIG